MRGLTALELYVLDDAYRGGVSPETSVEEEMALARLCGRGLVLIRICRCGGFDVPHVNIEVTPMGELILMAIRGKLGQAR